MALFISVVARKEEQVKRVIEGVWCPMDESSRWRKRNTPRAKLTYCDVVLVLVGSWAPGYRLILPREHETVIPNIEIVTYKSDIIGVLVRPLVYD